MVLLTLAKPRLAWSTCLLPISLFALAPLAHGQGYSNQAMASAVSVHELQVPYKARNEYQKGLDHLNKQDAAGSVSHFAKAIEKDSNFYEAYYELGVAQVRLGQNDEAMTSFQSAIDRSGGSFALAEFAYGLLLCHKGKALDAERLVRRGLEHDQDSPDGQLALGIVSLYLHRPDQAEKSAQEVLSRNSQAANAYLILADAHGEKDNYPAEVQDLNAFLRLEPKGSRSDFARKLLVTAQRLASENVAKAQLQNAVLFLQFP